MKTDRLRARLGEIDRASLPLRLLNPKALSVFEDTRLLIEQQNCLQFSSVDQLSSAEIDQIIEDSERLAASGNLVVAEILLIGLLLQSKEHENALVKLAHLYEAQSSYALTVEITRELLASQSTNNEAAYQLSFALHRQGNLEDALEWILPYYISDPTPRISRLCALILKGLGRLGDAVDLLASVVEDDQSDVYSIRALSEIYVEVGMYKNALEVLHKVPENLVDKQIKLSEAIIYRFMGDLDKAIDLNDQLIADNCDFIDALWTQCFNYSISESGFCPELLIATRKYWEPFLPSSQCQEQVFLRPSYVSSGRRAHIGFLTSDIGDHVVSRFLAPLLRGYPREDIQLSLLSTSRRYESKGLELASLVDCAISLNESSGLAETRAKIEEMNFDVIFETNGFTRNSGLSLLAHRCSPVQCHYIGYHATTGLGTIDYFLGDAITAPPEFQWQYTEKLVQIPSLWMAYDKQVEFGIATAKVKRESPVLGAFSQVTKINALTLQYWSAAMRAAPQAILVIKDRGVQCQASRERIEETMKTNGVDPNRVYFIGPVASHYDHLDSYNAIDIALDTTPWSGATTAFEALGMGVPLVAICGDKTSSRMSASVVHSAGMNYLVAKSIDQFALIVAELCQDYQKIRQNKSEMQQQTRAGLLFDERRICSDFFATTKKLISSQF